MIIDISDSTFKNIFNEKKLYLPVRWKGDDFLKNLKEIFSIYMEKINSICKDAGKPSKEMLDARKIVKRICNLLEKTVEHYLNGFPAKAYSSFRTLMKILIDNPLKTYNKSVYELLGEYDDNLKLFRVAIVNENILQERKRLFHTPYDLRSKVATCRYSIAGYPSLYLGTNLELCCEEVNYKPHTNYGIASRFQLVRNFYFNHIKIKVIELSLKPQDFLLQESNNIKIGRSFKRIDLKNKQIRSSYLLWYPIIAACSFIRANKQDPFAAEYIIPQLLMQWVRSEISKGKEHIELIGIRYFSCASERASDLGFNYVFPVSGQCHSDKFMFCPILMRAFKLTKPYYFNNYDTIDACEKALVCDTNIKFIDEK